MPRALIPWHPPALELVPLEPPPLPLRYLVAIVLFGFGNFALGILYVKLILKVVNP